MEKLVIRDVSFTYPEQTESALTGVTLTVQAGEFLLLCGPSGCGKSTLLRLLKPALAPHGERTGEILLDGTAPEKLSLYEQSARIGFVRQNPEEQIITDKVWHELAFGPESLGMDSGTIRRRVAEMAAFFGMESWYRRDTASLSGGQKQLLNLAAVMVLQPELLILDEPTAQLDPIAASEFLGTLWRLNREFGTTVLLTEHRLEEAMACADRVAVMENGTLAGVCAPREAGTLLGKRPFAPAAMALWAACDGAGPCPVTVREGRDWLAARKDFLPVPPERVCAHGDAVITTRDLWYRYEREGAEILRGLELTVNRGELLAILGGNGAGKSTVLRLLAGIAAPQRGELSVTGTVGLLPQDPKLLFLKKTLREELADADEAKTAETVRLCGLEDLLDRHPYDLSGGEQQRAALAKLLLREPEILLLDEPTKGLDGECREALAELLQTLTAQGVTVVLVSHDVEFCARYAHRCALLFDGNVVTEGTPRQFFAGNRHYTTAANRMARDTVPDAVTTDELIAACGGIVPPPRELPRDAAPLPPPRAGTADWKPRPLPLWRKLLAALLLAVAAAGVLWAVTAAGQGDETNRLWQYGLCLAAMAGFALCVFRRQPPAAPLHRQKLTKRTVAACITILLCIPATLYVGLVMLQNANYYLVMLLVLLECMLPFFFVFEKRRPNARELTLLAVLCALGVAGRALFFMLPECKPVAALTIVAGVALGGESGFFVGALTMLVSNLLFGQGPWTPWQMFAMGLIGFLAGVLFRKGLLRRSRAALCIYGVFASIVLYGGIMNPASALMWAGELSWSVLVPYWVAGFPMDCVQGLSTALFLWFAAMPMLEKLDRIKVKYGLVE